MQKKDVFAIGLIILCGTFAGNAWIFADGFLHTHDGGQNIQYFIAADDNIQFGNFPPAWNANAWAGSGEPLYFYNPFIIYLIEFIHIFEHNFFKAIDLVVPITYAASGISFFLLARKVTKITFVSMISSIFYMYAPYRFTDSNSRGDFAEAAAFIFIPLIIYFIIKIDQNISTKASIKYFILAGTSLALLIISHALTAYLFFIFVFIPYLMYKIICKKELKQFKYFFIIFFIAASLTAYYWLPVALETRYINSQDFLNQKLESYPMNLGALLLNEKWNVTPDPGFHFFIGYLAEFAMLVGLLFFHRKRSISYLTILTVAIILLTTKEGIPIFKLLPGANYEQFTFRLLTIITFTTSILLALVIKELYFHFSKKLVKPDYNVIFVYGITCGLIIAIILSSYPLTKVMYWVIDNPTKDQMCCFAPSVLTYLPVSVPVSYAEDLQEKFTYHIKEYTNLHGERDNLFATFKPLPLYTIISDYSDNNTKSQVKMNIIDYPTIWKVDSNNSNTELVSFRIFYYPGWHVYLDGKELPKNYDKKTGHITVQIPSGIHHIKIVFEDTFVRLIGKIITLISISVILCYLFVKWGTQKPATILGRK